MSKYLFLNKDIPLTHEELTSTIENSKIGKEESCMKSCIIYATSNSGLRYIANDCVVDKSEIKEDDFYGTYDYIILSCDDVYFDEAIKPNILLTTIDGMLI